MTTKGIYSSKFLGSAPQVRKKFFVRYADAYCTGAGVDWRSLYVPSVLMLVQAPISERKAIFTPSVLNPRENEQHIYQQPRITDA